VWHPGAGTNLSPAPPRRWEGSLFLAFPPFPPREGGQGGYAQQAARPAYNVRPRVMTVRPRM
jgi:hypothetical protein